MDSTKASSDSRADSRATRVVARSSPASARSWWGPRVTTSGQVIKGAGSPGQQLWITDDLYRYIFGTSIGRGAVVLDP